MITVKDIAKMCGVSPSTVSNILNGKNNKVSEETKKRVMAVVEQNHYKPNYFASSMRRQNSKCISIIVEDLHQFTTPAIVVAIMAYCEEKGYRTVLFNLRMYDRWKNAWFKHEDMLIRFLYPALDESSAIKVDGVIYIAGHGRVISCLPEEYKIPIVMAYATNKDDRYPSILIDDRKGGYDIGKYILKMGHTEIGVIAGMEDNMHTEERLIGFKKALAEAGISYNPNLVINGSWTRESGYDKAESILETGVKCIWCMNDQMAAGVYDYLYEHDIHVGKDISVIGFDNMEHSAYMYPRITTNALPLSEIGHKAAEMMIKIIDNPDWKPDEMKMWIPCKMVYGNSVVDLSEMADAKK